MSQFTDRLLRRPEGSSQCYYTEGRVAHLRVQWQAVVVMEEWAGDSFQDDQEQEGFVTASMLRIMQLHAPLAMIALRSLAQ